MIRLRSKGVDMMKFRKIFLIVLGLFLLTGLDAESVFPQTQEVSGDEEVNGLRGFDTAISRLATDSRQFVRTLDRELDKGRYNGTRYEDDVNRKAKSFLRAVERLERVYRLGARERQLLEFAGRMLDQGADLNRIIERGAISPIVNREWERIHQTLRAFARWHREKGRNSTR